MTDLVDELMQSLNREKLRRMDPEERVTKLVAMVKSGAGPKKTVAFVGTRRAWEDWVYRKLKDVADGKIEAGVEYAAAFHCCTVDQLHGRRLSNVIMTGEELGWSTREHAELQFRIDQAKALGWWRGR